MYNLHSYNKTLNNFNIKGILGYILFIYQFFFDVITIVLENLNCKQIQLFYTRDNQYNHILSLYSHICI
jgi:hypothetical protein